MVLWDLVLLLPLAYRFPQRLVLSPVLFNIFIKQLGEVARGLGQWCHQFADDTHLYLNIPLDFKEAMKPLNQCLVRTMKWMKANQAEAESCQDSGAFGVLGSGYIPRLEGVSLTPKTSVFSLGAILDAGLLLDDQVIES